MSRAKRLLRESAGLVTAEWVVLLAVLMVGGIFAISQIYDTGIAATSTSISEAAQIAGNEFEEINLLQTDN